MNDQPTWITPALLSSLMLLLTWTVKWMGSTVIKSIESASEKQTAASREGASCMRRLTTLLETFVAEERISKVKNTATLETISSETRDLLSKHQADHTMCRLGEIEADLAARAARQTLKTSDTLVRAAEHILKTAGNDKM